MKKKLTLVVSLLLVMALSIGGTIAWLTDTDSVTNTFTIGNVDITLSETDSGLDNDNDDKTNSYKFVPGIVLAKDPVVTVKAGSEPCYVFVKIDETIGNEDTNKVEYVAADKTTVEKVFTDYFDYGVRAGWTKGDGDKIPANVYYREYDAADGDDDGEISDAATYYVLTAGTPTNTNEAGENGVITVKDSVTKEMVDALSTDGYKDPQLTFTAYAIQKAGFENDVVAAWGEVSGD